jgi:glycosyltransferase involved in cell wall biosynthesis
MHGGEISLLETIQSLIMYQNCTIKAILPGEPNSTLEKKLVEMNVEVYHGISNVRWVDFRPKLVRVAQSGCDIFMRMSRLLKGFHPEIVIINTIVTNPAFAICAKAHGIRVIWYIHELGDLDHGYRFLLGKQLTFKIAAWVSDQIIFNSRYTASHYNKQRKPNIIDYPVTYTVSVSDDYAIQKFLRRPETWQILIAGRTWPGKGQLDVVKALDWLINKYHVINVRLIILGAVPCLYLDTIVATIKDKGLTDFVELIQFQDDIVRWFRSSHIGITASHSEAFGRITVEFLKYGMITIGADSGGTHEILANVPGTLTYHSGDYVQLANLLRNIINSDFCQLASSAHSSRRYACTKYSLHNHYLQFSAVVKKALK